MLYFSPALGVRLGTVTVVLVCVFFFQAEDGIRDSSVTGVQTCALPIFTYRGLPAPLVCDFMSREESRRHYAAGTEFHIGKIEMVANTGTYLDAPFHRYAEDRKSVV